MDYFSNLLNERLYIADSGKIYGSIVGAIEKTIIIKILERSGGNQVQAAKRLGIHRNTLHNKIKEFKINVKSFKR